MSAANAAARKRRAGGAQIDPPGRSPIPPQPQQSPVPPSPTTGLSLQQVIQLVDARLLKLEGFMKSQLNSPVGASASNSAFAPSSELLESMRAEFNDKFEMLAEELADLKDIVLKLQSYTMEVNKTLMEERINILSDMKPEETGETFELTADTIIA